MKTNPSISERSGFTLIEMLVTITIIVILAGLSLGGFKFVSTKQAYSQAEIQIKLLENGIEEYKLDTGEYPESGIGNLFRALYKDRLNNVDGNNKIYVSQLDPENNKQGWTIPGQDKITDPWGAEYIYRRSSDPRAVNPDFDLLSKGQDGSTNLNDLNHAQNKDDVANF